MPRITQIQVRRDTAANWTTANPVLASGELGLESDTRLMKSGDGSTAWSSLSYLWADLNLSVTDVFTAASQVAMLALTAQPGDVAIRTDLGNAAYMLVSAPASTLANWQVLGSSPIMTASSSGAAGAAGMTPVNAAGTQNSFLRGDATWSNVIDGGSA